MDKSMPPPPPPGFMSGPPPPAHGFMSGPPPPHYGAPPPPAYSEGQPNIVIVGQPVFDSEPQRVTCPHCHADITTRVETESNSRTHLYALMLCFVGLFCCAPCPYCIDSCLTKKHYCPACKAFLGQSSN